MKNEIKKNREVIACSFFLFVGIFLFIFFLMPTVSSQPLQCTPNILSYWPMDDDPAPPIDELLGLKNGTCTSCPTNVIGILNDAQEFNGSNEVDVSDSFYDFGLNDEFSIEYWMKSSSTCPINEVIVGRDDPGATNLHWWTGCTSTSDQTMFVLRDSNGSIGGNTDWPVSGFDVTDGSWHHIVAIKNMSHIMIYVDGIWRDSVAKTYTADFSGVSDLNIGYLDLGGGFHYNGSLDEVAIYNRALTGSEILDHYSNGVGVPYCSPIAPFCGDGIVNGNEECDDGNNNNGDGCSDICEVEIVQPPQQSFPLLKIPVETCTGTGDLFLYQNDSFQPINTSLIATEESLLIFSRDDVNLTVEVNNVITPLVLENLAVNPFGVMIHSVSTSPGDQIEIFGDHILMARAVQGYLAYDPVSPIYNVSDLHLLFNSQSTTFMTLTQGNYDLVFFDKFTLKENGVDPDLRPLRVDIDGPGGSVYDQILTSPSPFPNEGAVITPFNVNSSNEGQHTLFVDTTNSVYWLETQCELESVPFCGDGNLDAGEQCDDGNNQNGDGCDANCRVEEEICPDERFGLIEPGIWMRNNSRIILDDATEPGRISLDGEELLERTNNYAFEGEQISFEVLVIDSNGVEKITDVYVALGDGIGGGEVEANCRLTGEEPDRIEDFFVVVNEERKYCFDRTIMQIYECLFTVETPESMYGEFFVTGEVLDFDGNVGIMDELEYWFLNPVIALNIDGDIVFSNARPGTTVYSDTLLVENAADSGSGVLLDMFITGTDFYDSASSGTKCPTSNQLSLTNFRYFATNGAYSTLADSLVDVVDGDRSTDAEGYINIEYGIGFNDPSPFYNNAEIIQAPIVGPYYAANTIAPGAEMAMTFKVNVPEPCNGDFDTGQISFWGEAI